MEIKMIKENNSSLIIKEAEDLGLQYSILYVCPSRNIHETIYLADGWTIVSLIKIKTFQLI